MVEGKSQAEGRFDEALHREGKSALAGAGRNPHEPVGTPGEVSPLEKQHIEDQERARLLRLKKTLGLE